MKGGKLLLTKCTHHIQHQLPCQAQFCDNFIYQGLLTDS
nr:MAG TPA: hypothetical protein [Caudoviricetes sp.]